MASVSIRTVKKNFGEVPILHGVDIEIKDGSFTVLVGPSGCGKSTLLRMIAGLEEISSGEIHIGNRQVNDLPPKERDIAMVFQNYALFPHLNVFDNVAFGLKFEKKGSVSTKPEKERVMQALELVSLAAFSERRVPQLSGGEQQRIVIARALLNNPQLILADEPTGNLDPQTSEDIVQLLYQISQQTTTSVLIGTHDFYSIQKFLTSLN